MHSHTCPVEIKWRNLEVCDDPRITFLLEEEIIDKIMGSQYDKTMKNKGSNSYEWKPMGNYYWPLDELCQPLLMKIFGEKDLGFYCIISPFKGMKSQFLKEEGEQCKVHAWITPFKIRSPEITYFSATQ